MRPVPKKVLQTFQQWGEEGGRKRAKNLSSLRRRAIAMHAAQVRWGLRKGSEPFFSSVRLEKPNWEDPVYLEEILSHGNLGVWKELHRIIADRPFGAQAKALENVLDAVDIYGATSLWKGILRHLQGACS